MVSCIVFVVVAAAAAAVVAVPVILSLPEVPKTFVVAFANAILLTVGAAGVVSTGVVGVVVVVSSEDELSS